MYRAQYLALGVGTTMVRQGLETALPSEMLWADNSGGGACGFALLPQYSVRRIADRLQRLDHLSLAASAPG